MKQKKDATAPQKAIGNFCLKAEAGKSVVIEGFANKAVSDRIGDLIPPEAWELDNFRKNPIIFFNHDRNLPIGRAIDTKVTDDGLKIKVRISKSDQAPIPYIRDMIEEGILRTFSVGFDDHNTAYKSDDGHNSFKRAELLETSVVTIPMNQDSDFELVAMKSNGEFERVKSKADIKSWKAKSYNDVVNECLSAKGAYVAAVAKYYIDNNPERHHDFNEVYHEYLIGEKEADDAFIKSCAEEFLIDEAKLISLNKEYDDEDEEEKSPDEEEEDEEEEKSQDQDAEDDEKSDKKDFQECVAGKIPKFIDEGMERDQAIAAAISHCQEGKSCEVKADNDDLALFCEIADQKAKSSDEEEEEEEKEKQVETKETEEPSVAIDNTMSEYDLGQPGIELQKSSLALQGSMLNETKELKAAQNKTNELLQEMIQLMKKGDTSPEMEEVEDTKEGIPEDSAEDVESEEMEKRLKGMRAIEEKLNKMEKIQAYHEKLNRLMSLS